VEELGQDDSFRDVVAGGVSEPGRQLAWGCVWLVERYRDDALTNFIGNVVRGLVWLLWPVFEGI
jgi:hypothetical protein